MEKIIIKLSGEIFYKPELLKNVAIQIKELQKKYIIGLVIGAGNIFRGDQQGKDLNIKKTTGHSCGMIATHINSLILQDLFQQNNIKTSLFSSFNCPLLGCVIKQENINNAINNNSCLIFAGGTGNPFFTTDTTAILRASQMNAKQVWKGTKVDGIYSDDPQKAPDSKFYEKISYEDVIQKQLKIMDITAITLARQNSIQIRVFNIFDNNALLNADKNKNLGSQIG